MYVDISSFTFDDTTEQIAVKTHRQAINLPSQPIGTYLLELLNADLNSIVEILESCIDNRGSSPIVSAARIGAPGLWLPDFLKFKAATESIRRIIPTYSELFYNDNIHAAWTGLTYEFCGRHPNGELPVLTDVQKFKQFIDELSVKPEYFSFDFLEYLNNIERMQPTSISPCSIRSTRIVLAGNKNTVLQPVKALYAGFLRTKNLPPKVYHYDSNGYKIGTVLVASLLELARRGKVIRKCENCGRYFIPENRSDTLYCDNPSPQDESRTCKQYGSQRLWYERQREDELATLSRNVLSSKSMLAKRNPDYRPYVQSYDYFREERKKWIKAVKGGSKTKDEYREWLLLMQSQKVIKEAVSKE